MRHIEAQKRQALMNMTEDDTPFKATTTQKIFKNAPNVALRGATYDAKHLDSFLGSGFGEKSVQVNSGNAQTSARPGPGGGGGSNLVNYLVSGSSNHIKPSVSFLSLGRHDYKQTKYTDEHDGPSPMQTVGNEQAYKDKHPDKKTIFEKEREEHISQFQNKIQLLNEAKKTLYTPPADTSQLKLKSPKELREEVKKVKDQLKEFNNFKQNQILLGQRDRTMKGGWRHGVTGIDNATSNNTSVFYQDTKKDRDFWQNEKDIINGRRLEKIKTCFGTSAQLSISSDHFKRTTSLFGQKPETVVDIHEKWRTKHIVHGSQSQLDTHRRLYIPASNVERQQEDGCMKKIKLERSMKLRQEDLRNRNTNIITNNQEDKNVWLNSFGEQKDQYFNKFNQTINQIHQDRSQIATSFTEQDKANENSRVNIEYMPKKRITHETSIRYKHIPKDSGIF